MKNIKTKSLQYKKLPTDGLRICIMRRVKPEYDFDVWIPKLSPSEKLLDEYVISKKINWSEFTKKFKKNVIDKQPALLQLLAIISKDRRITLLCWEKSQKQCHRRLILEALEKFSLSKRGITSG